MQQTIFSSLISSCRMVNMGEHITACVRCGDSFSVDTTQQCWWSKKYCGEECKKAALSASRRQKMADGKARDVVLAPTAGPQGGRMVVITCEWCGKEREVPFEKRDTRFCAKPATCCYDFLKKPKPVLTDEQRLAKEMLRRQRSADSRRGQKRSKEQRANIAEGTKKAWDEGKYKNVDFSVPPERRKKIAETVRQRWQEGAYEGWDQSYRTPEHNAQHSKAMKEIWANGDHNMVAPEQTPWTEERRQAQSERLKGIPKPPRTDEHREKLREARLKGFREGRLSPGGQMWWSYVGPQGVTIKMRSEPEVMFAHHLDSLGVVWEYESRRFDLGWSTYAPDFFLPDFDHYIEVKGFWKEESYRKAKEFAQDHRLFVFMATPIYRGIFPETVSDLFARNHLFENLANVKIHSATPDTAPELYE